jgi:hypothetical protein
VTDAGILALSDGCGQLQSIDLYGCRNVTDAGIFLVKNYFPIRSIRKQKILKQRNTEILSLQHLS